MDVMKSTIHVVTRLGQNLLIHMHFIPYGNHDSNGRHLSPSTKWFPTGLFYSQSCYSFWSSSRTRKNGLNSRVPVMLGMWVRNVK